MEFSTNLMELNPIKSVSFTLNGVQLPTNKHVYIRSLQKQIFEQYCSARIFMHETDTTDWRHWFSEQKTEAAEKYCEWRFKGNFLECALFYYNMLIDLSWTLCYVAAEYSVSDDKGQRIEFEGIASIEESVELLKKAQRNVTAPTAEENPFEYLRMMNPAFEKAIDMVISFWSEYQQNPLRTLYNYCKHRGQPLYEEVSAYTVKKPYVLFFQGLNDKNKTEIPTDTSEVMYKVSIADTIQKLKVFDEQSLFPYLKQLFIEINQAVNPSPLAQ